MPWVFDKVLSIDNDGFGNSYAKTVFVNGEEQQILFLLATSPSDLNAAIPITENQLNNPPSPPPTIEELADRITSLEEEIKTLRGE